MCAMPWIAPGTAHITGGGFYENIPRIFTDPNQAALINIDAWRVPEVFSFLKQAGNIDDVLVGQLGHINGLADLLGQLDQLGPQSNPIQELRITLSAPGP